MSQKNQITTADHLSYPEFQRLLECLHNDGEYRWEAFARLSFCTACRVSDVRKFKWSDILDKHTIYVKEQKTKKTRKVTLNPKVQAKFRELYELLGSPEKDQFIVISRKKPECPLTTQRLNQKLKEMKDAYNLKIENFSTHTFRKTFGRYVYDKNGHSAESLLLLNKILNHSSIQVTKVYIGITQEEVDGIFNSIEF